jgi:hypothetical protein
VNLVPARYRSVSVASVPVSLDEACLRAYFTGRPAYRRTRYIVARAAPPGAGPAAAGPAAAGPAAAGPAAAGTANAPQPACAVVEVSKRTERPLFSEITAVTLIAGPAETAFVDAPKADTGIPTTLSQVAADRAPGARCVVVQGRYGHVGFIVDPEPVRIRVVEVVPPHPAKLVDQARRVLEVAEDLPPVELVPELTDLRALADNHPAGHYLFPCRAGTAVAGAEVSYLDEIPPEADWTLIGCARSRDIHDWFYQRQVPAVDMCPRNLALRAAGQLPGPVLTKCCLLEDKIAVTGELVVVPWGATLAEIRDGLGRAVAVARAAGRPGAAGRAGAGAAAAVRPAGP